MNDDTLKAKLWRDGGFECLIVNNDSKCQTVNDGSERQTKDTMALNAKLWENSASECPIVNNGSECQPVNDNSERQIEQWLWMLN